ncbi:MULTISPECIES: type II secretion system protein GspL [Pseudoalteromonas]|uniref:Type II secretion system protein L n=1 Tax=Pseudoalteromonas piscicida TaxID=43662 RepID=A0ABM6NGQ9_PSEO7|nr:type II secretion system protein GspL [Pseudoalteromonas piscicida]ATD08056.1 general secretion pathway protein L [Pseudoalteromonas piscicida]MCO7201648.1 type II secretion system protein GspL [Pseudoalteromonas sp. OANN1]WPU30127.1 type II secretion system protein GspL [Pseudoalteromonas piscicida]
MTEQLLIRVDQSHQATIHWLVWSTEQQQIIASGELEGSEQLGSLAEKAQTRPVVLLLPATAVQLRTLELPAKWNRKLEQALPFMLEEHVATDIDALFIAIGKPGMKADTHTIDVAICDSSWLQSWFSAFDDAGISVSKALPDALCLPLHEEMTSAVQLGQQWLFKHNAWQVGTAELSWVNEYLTIAGVKQLAHFSPAIDFSETITLTAQQQDYDLPLAIFAKSLSNIDFNLRQGRFAAKKKQPQWWRDWRSGLIAASVAVVSFIAIKGTQLYVISHQANQLETQAVAMYQQAFPNKVVRPHLLKKQIQNELDALSGTEQGGLLELTNHFVAIYEEVDAFAPETLRYDKRRNELRIRARAKEFQVFGQVKAILEQRGVSVEQGALNNDGDFVVGEIRIRGAA